MSQMTFHEEKEDKIPDDDCTRHDLIFDLAGSAHWRGD